MAIFTLPIARVGDDNFRVGSGYKLYFYEAGTLTAKDTYTDNTYTTPLSNPVVADGNGRFPVIWTTGDYKVRLTTDEDVIVWTVDNYSNDTASTKFAEGVLSAAGSAANVITANLPTTPGSLVDQLQVVVELQHGANTAAAVTFNLNGLGAKTVKRDNNQPLAIGDTGGSGYKLYLSYSSANDVWILLNPVNPIGQGLEFIKGLEVTNNTTDADHDLDIAAGSILDSDEARILSLTSATTKRLDAPFAVGSGNGGMCNQDDSGTLAADSTYHIYIIGKADGTTDIIGAKRGTDPLTDTVAAAAGFIYKRRIFTVMTRSAANILAYHLNTLGYVNWSIPYSVTTSVSTSGALSQSQSPPLQMARLTYELAAQTSTSTDSLARGYISEESQANVAPTTLFAQVTSQISAQGLGNFTTLTIVTRTNVDVICNASQEFRHREAGDAQAIHINTMGWFNDLTVETGA